MDKVSNAVELMKGSYSCSQSVLCAFCDDAGLTHDEAKKIAAPYSGGRAIKCGAINCRDIRRNNLRPCIGCVEDSATILSKMLAN